jgi:hypothetical protein
MASVSARHAPGLLAQKLSDFRAGEIERVTESSIAEFADNVMQVCDWMDEEHRDAFLTGLLTSLGSSYWSKRDVLDLFMNEEFSASQTLHIVHVQEDESSQTTLVKLLRETSSGGFDETQGLDTSALLYVDDATYTGRALARNLGHLADRIELLPRTSRVLNVFHLLQYSAEIAPVVQPAVSRLAALGVATEFRSAIDGDFEGALSWDFRIAPSAEMVSRPHVQRFLQSSTALKSLAANLDEACKPDTLDVNDMLFDSEFERKTVTQALLDVGIKIRSITPNWNATMRPLGYIREARLPSFGFGSMFCTFHNSANTSPLALWWGNPEAGSHSALSEWKPLLPRRSQ